MVEQPTPHADRPSITAFFPCYNDSGTIASVVIAADRTLRELTDDYEIIVSNDASTDNSQQILAELCGIYPHLRVLQQSTNRGYGGNLRCMFAAATKDLIFYTDGDAQYDPAELADLYVRLGPDTDVVQGWKIERHDPLHRKIIGRVYHHFVKWWFGLHLRDVDCDFRLFRRHVLESFPLESNSGCITVEMMARVEQGGFKVVEVPVHHFHRAYGESQFFNFSRVARTLIELTVIWVRLKMLPRRPSSASATPPRALT
ncbi:MAG TPA: glycosyltransferase family 2 protein [Chloroflexota bacterium]|jgi:glycosyltransferase involved in cell wall biosynthesis|nr:glycosyltransferase family 2 protein [Chloroflexota bacterium]